jgi:beta-galactosidase beta subunit
MGFLIPHDTYSQTKQTTIEVIKNNPTSFEGDEVEFTGLVIQYVKDKGSTNYYLIKGDYGGILRVNTSEPAPETNVKYRVKGIVYIDGKTNTVFVSEKLKVLLPSGSEVKPNPKLIDPPPPQLENNTLLYALLAVLAVLVGAFIYFQLRKRNLDLEPSPANAYNDPILPPQQQGYSTPEYKEAKPDYTTDNDYKTIKIVKTSPKTLKFIPGKLIINDGADRGKEFKIAGYPTPNGFIVTIGRNEVSGDRAYAHIQLNEKTVSREQAELHYVDHKLFVKNLSETNFTQLNGSELKPGQSSEVSNGSTIRTGEVEFKYVV